MRTSREGPLSSLVVRLTLAVLALLLLSLGLTTAVFVAQTQRNDRVAADNTLRQNAHAVYGRVFNALLNARPQRPLALVRGLGALGVDRVLVTSWDNNAVIGDTAYGGGPPSPPFQFPVPYQTNPQPGPYRAPDGVAYAYLAEQVPNSIVFVRPDTPPYRNVVILKRLATLSDLAASTITALARAGLVAIVVSSLAALAVLRAMTRPLEDMTRASEDMASGDYDQRVAGETAAGEIGQLARAFNRMAFEVKRAREAQRQFVANVSHDLRSPLTSIIGFSQALTDDTATTPQQRRIAGIINDEAARLHRLTVDLLDLSRLETGRLPLSRRPLELNSLLRELAARYHVLPDKRGVRFVERLCPEPLPVLGDPDRLAQVAVNLLDNARKFCNAGGEVCLSSSRRGDQAVVEVYNTGAGIAPDDLPRVFDRFYRGDHSRAQQTGGSGVGLAIVRELVHAHGGEVIATSEQGAWTAMTVRLPLLSGAQFTEDLQAANTGATGVVL